MWQCDFGLCKKAEIGIEAKMAAAQQGKQQHGQLGMLDTGHVTRADTVCGTAEYLAPEVTSGAVYTSAGESLAPSTRLRVKALPLLHVCR